MLAGMIPLWFIFALGASVFSALGMYMHQRLAGPSAASAVWMKILAVMIAIPALYAYGLPQNPMFYVYTGAAAMIWCVNDLVYFRAVQNHGAALLARLGPLALILSFVAWFAVKPALFAQYLQDLPRFGGIVAALTITAVCAMALKRCAFSWAALRDIWFVIIGGVIGIFLVKTAVDFTPAAQGVFGYLGFEAGTMLIFYAAYFSFFRRTEGRTIFTREGIRTGAIVGVFLVMGVIGRVYAQKYVDHPAFALMVGMLDVVWLMVLTRLSGWKDDSNKIAGLGIVAAAALLAFLKIR